MLNMPPKPHSEMEISKVRAKLGNSPHCTNKEAPMLLKRSKGDKAETRLKEAILPPPCVP